MNLAAESQALLSVPKWFIFLLAAVVATTPLAVDTYLPAMSAMAESMSAEMGMVQLSISVFLVGYASGLLTFGPLADIYGRRPVMLFGLAAFAVTSIVLAQLTTIESFLLVRFVQAFVGAGATVTVMGYVRLIYGDQMAKGISYVSMIMMMAPAVAPTLGVMLLGLGGWPVIFWVLGGYGCVMWLLALAHMPKVKPQPRKGTLFEAFFGAYAIVLGEKAVRRNIIIVALGSMGFFGYLTASPYIYMTVFGVDEQTFGLLFALNVGMFFCANLVNSRIVGRFGSKNMLTGALALSTVGAAGLVGSVWAEMGLLWFVVFLALYLGGTLVVNTNNDALILLSFKNQTGTATGTIGTLRFWHGRPGGADSGMVQ